MRKFVLLFLPLSIFIVFGCSGGSGGSGGELKQEASPIEGTDLLPPLPDPDPIVNHPSIRTIQPDHGPTGSPVTIFGKNFDLEPDNNKVLFGTVEAEVRNVRGDPETEMEIDIITPQIFQLRRLRSRLR